MKTISRCLFCSVFMHFIVLGQTIPGDVLWSYTVIDPVEQTPSLGSDKTLYVPAIGSLIAITNNGSSASNKWSLPLTLAGAPAIASDGTIFGVGGGKLWAIDPEGLIKWSFAGGGGGGSPALAVDGTVYFHGWEYVYAVSPDGKLRWRVLTGDSSSFPSPSVASDGTIYIGSWERRELLAVKPDGAMKWARELSGNPCVSPAFAADGSIYFAAGELYAFTEEGELLWSLENTLYQGAPAVGSPDRIYCSAGPHTLYAIARNGNQAWAYFEYGSRAPYTTVAADNLGSVYYAASNTLFALSPEGTIQWKLESESPYPAGIGAALTSPVLGPDGTLYVILGKTVYAVASGATGPADSPWPMYRGNARHTGRVEKPALGKPKKRADANLEFQLFPHQLGLTYDFQNSTNLATWTSLTSIVAQAFPVDVVDLTATNSPTKFYRAVSGP